MKKLSYRAFTRIQNVIMGCVIVFALLNVINYYAIKNAYLMYVSYAGAGVSLVLLLISYVYKKTKLKNEQARRPSRRAEKDVIVMGDPAKAESYQKKQKKEDE